LKQAVVALGFGAPASLDANKNIAWSAYNKARELGDVLVFTQLGPSIHLLCLHTLMPGERVGHYPSTMQVATAAVAWAQEHSITKLWIAAAKPHMWRALRDFKLAVTNARADIEIIECPQAKVFHSVDWFNPKSEEWWARSRLQWLMREIPLCLIPTPLYLKLTNKPF
jgi:hypothetical protein